MYHLFTKVRLFLYYRLLHALGIRLAGGHFFHAGLLTRHSGTVIDGGANIGKFSGAMATQNYPVFAIEPVPEYVEQLKAIQGVTPWNGVLTGKAGSFTFFVSNALEASSLHASIPQGSGSHTNAITVPGCTLTALQAQFGLHSISLLKLDIEGAEIEVLDSLSDEELKVLPQLLIEFHDFILPQQLPDIARCMQRLESLGFITIRATRNYLMDMVFINRQSLKPSLLWWLTYRLWKGVAWPYKPLQALTNKAA